MLCCICKRKLNVDDDPLSLDCGGACWGCIGEMEADSRYEPSLEKVRQEYRDGLRDSWLPSPLVSCTVEDVTVTVCAKFERPLGESWEGVEVSLRLATDFSSASSDKVLESVSKVSGNDGYVNHTFHISGRLVAVGLCIQIHRAGQIWSYPVQK